jgi:plastocyanin
MKLRIVGAAAALLVATVGLGASQGGATDNGGRTIQTRGIDSVQINVRLQSTLRMRPGDTTIKSGDLLTFKDVDGTSEPHTLTIVNQADLPTTIDQVQNCGSAIGGGPSGPPSAAPAPPDICTETFIAASTADPRITPGPGGFPGPGQSEFLKLSQDGTAGLSGRLDTILIGDASSQTVPVTAAPGTTLHFMCVIHPWMQGTIQVTG